MTHTCDLSVIVTAYNQNATLELVLSLLETQDYAGGWEVIVCDDGSDEDTLSIVKSASNCFNKQLRYVWQARNGFGLARSRNNALRCANGDVIVLMDADLAVPSDFLSRHAKCHSQGQRRLVCGIRRWLFVDDLPHGTRLEFMVRSLLTSHSSMAGLYSEMPAQKKYAQSTHPWLSCRGCNFSFSRDIQPHLFDETFNGWGGEDIEFACRLHLRHGYEISFDPETVGLHLEEGHRHFVAVRAESHGQIVQFLRNIVYFCDSYPDFDMSPACESFGLFELDPASNNWRKASRPRFSREHIHSILATARGWLTDSGLRQVPRYRQGTAGPVAPQNPPAVAT